MLLDVLSKSVFWSIKGKQKADVIYESVDKYGILCYYFNIIMMF